MAPDPAGNFDRSSLTSDAAAGDTTLNVNDASEFIDPSQGNYNVVIWDDGNYPSPYEDPNVEIVRVVGQDTNNNTLSVNRGQENTAAASHPSGSAIMHAPTAKLIDDILGLDHSTADETAIPNAGLANSAITITGGDGLKGGGGVALGGSITLDIEPADFAGTALEDDGSDNLQVAPGGITSTEIDYADQVVERPERPPIAELDDGDSIEIPVRVPDQSTLKVYRWGAYDASDGTTPASLTVELLDGSDTVQASANTANNQNKSAAVASHQNTTGSLSIYKVRAKNGTGSAITSPGVGFHAGFRVE